MQITSLHSLNAFLLPIKTVGVQVSCVNSLTCDITSAALSANIEIRMTYKKKYESVYKFKNVKR